MDKVKYIFFTLLLLFFFDSFGQNASITGIVRDSIDPISFASLTLTNDSSKTIYKATTGVDGSYFFNKLPEGIYTLFLSRYINYCEQTIKHLKVGIQDVLKEDFILEKCSWNYELRACPICNKNDLVIRVNYNQVHYDYAFGNYKKTARYYKKTVKQGYVTQKENEQEILWLIKDKTEHTKLNGTSICDKFLFCKRDKKVFQLK